MTDLFNFVPSVNFHLWEPCNMRCKFCFATFQDVKQSILPKGHLPKEQSIQVVEQLASFGIQKITFAGGEPTLCRWLPELIATAKAAGMTTMIVTNGSQLSDEFLLTTKNSLDWIALSIDSLSTQTNLSLGRAISGKKTLSEEYYRLIVDKIKKYGFGLKINTVVTRTNMKENMSDFILYAQPERWKILQVLPIVGQNDQCINDLVISAEDFQNFIDKHCRLQDTVKMITETNEQMQGSYAMVDPAGRFFDNSTGTYQYSLPILEIGVQNALQQVNFDFEKFLTRGGLYKWQRENPNS